MKRNRLPAACAALCLIFALAGCGGAAASSAPSAPASVPAASEPASVSSQPEASSLPEEEPAPDYPTFEAEGYTVAYRVIPPEEVDEINADTQMIGPKEGDLDTATAKAVVVEFVSATKDGEEAKVDTAMREIPTGRLKFLIDGVEYRTIMTQSASQTGLTGGFKIVCTWFAVPLDTPDIPSLEITFE